MSINHSGAQRLAKDNNFLCLLVLLNLVSKFRSTTLASVTVIETIVGHILNGYQQGTALPSFCVPIIGSYHFT